MSTPIGSSQWMYASGAEVTQQSLKFNDDESQYLSWTPAAAGNRKTWTWSGWVKRGNLGFAQAIFSSGTATSDIFNLQFLNDDTLRVFDRVSSTNRTSLPTNAVFRDPSAWMNIVCVYDLDQAVDTDRVKLWVNGVEQSFSSSTYPTQGYTSGNVNKIIEHNLGRSGYSAGYLDSYLSDIHFIDGQALDPTSFGQFTNGYWEAIDYAGSYGTNGFHLTFQDDVVSEGFNAVTYRGTGQNQSVSGLGLNPDLVWMKRRTADDHDLQDSVRGGGKTLMSHSTAAETNLSGSYGINSFDADGFSLVGNGGRTNESGGSYVAWAWDAGSGSPVSNTDGSITSTVKANPDYGFSIVSYTGTGSAATVGHGLSSAPEMVITKARNYTTFWIVNHKDLTSGTSNLYLQGTDSQQADGNWTAVPTSSVLNLGVASINQTSGNYISYCWHSVAGYSSFGSYSGTGAAGNAVTGLGFKPAWLMVKRTDAATTYSNWWIQDATRNPTNVGNTLNLAADNSNAETNALEIDFDSDGFTLQDASQGSNISGATYIYMAFADTREAAFWKDVSGQGNHWTPNNLDYRDSLIDSPANNFNTANPLAKSSFVTLSEGNLKVAGNSVSNSGNVTASSVVTSGKWYFEYLVAKNDGDTNYPQIAAYRSGLDEHRPFINGGTGTGGQVTNFFSLAFGLTNGDVLGISVDADGGTVKFYDNGSYISGKDIDISAYTSTGIWIGIGEYNTGFGFLNFGQDSTFSGNTTAGGNTDDNGIGDFKYAPPAGYLALCTSNLPTPTIVDGSEHFNTVLYTGNASTNAITGVGFDLSTDGGLVWMKNRASAYYHGLYDSVRGIGITKSLYSNAADAEGANSANQNLVSFDSDGFTLGSTTGTNAINTSGESHVAWNWKAGGTAVSNTDGSITSQVSANTDAGFSIVSYTGTGANATVGHGLGSVPKMIIFKVRNTTDNWTTYHAGIASDAETDGIFLNLTNAAQDQAVFFNDTAPTSSVFSISTNSSVNGSSNTYIAYCFADVDGFSKAGSYTGNGSTDGPFVYTGFRPSLILAKETGNTRNWFISYDDDTYYNGVTQSLFPNITQAEDANERLDFLSNGFKLRTTSTTWNNSSGNYIYLAFASTPFKFSPAR